MIGIATARLFPTTGWPICFRGQIRKVAAELTKACGSLHGAMASDAFPNIDLDGLDPEERRRLCCLSRWPPWGCHFPSDKLLWVTNDPGVWTDKVGGAKEAPLSAVR